MKKFSHPQFWQENGEGYGAWMFKTTCFLDMLATIILHWFLLFKHVCSLTSMVLYKYGHLHLAQQTTLAVNRMSGMLWIVLTELLHFPSYIKCKAFISWCLFLFLLIICDVTGPTATREKELFTHTAWTLKNTKALKILHYQSHIKHGFRIKLL